MHGEAVRHDNMFLEQVRNLAFGLIVNTLALQFLQLNLLPGDFFLANLIIPAIPGYLVCGLALETEGRGRETGIYINTLFEYYGVLVQALVHRLKQLVHGTACREGAAKTAWGAVMRGVTLKTQTAKTRCRNRLVNVILRALVGRIVPNTD